MQMTSHHASGGEVPSWAQRSTAGLRSAGETCRHPLRAHVDYDPDGALLFRLSGQEERRFALVLEDFRGVIPTADREWTPEAETWVLYGGWDEELLELLEEHFEPEEIFVRGHPLRAEET
jgi:hypothetical protein